MSDWQLIETAPKTSEDGHSPNILLLNWTHAEDYPASITVGFWGHVDPYALDDRMGWCDWCAGMDDDDVWEQFEPTHWQPLPAPPKSTP